MADIDMIYNQMKRKFGTGGMSGYFPNVNAISDTPQGQTLIARGSGYDTNQDARAASVLSRPMGKSNLTMLNSPQGGQIGVSSGQLQRYLDKGYTAYTPPRTASQQFDINRAYNIGYGAPNPAIQQGQGGFNLVNKGVVNPVENLTGQQRSQYGVPNFTERLTSAFGQFGTGTRAMGTLASNVWNRIFSRQPSGGQQGANLQAYNPSYNTTPGYSNAPRRYFDY